MPADSPQIILTSFHRSKRMQGAKFSICRFQPAGFTFPELRFFAAEDAKGERLRINDVGGPERFVKLYRQGLAVRWEAVKSWLASLKGAPEPIILLCWCPFSSETKFALKNEDKFFCHQGLIGKLINKHRPDVRLLLDEDLAYRLDERWRPESFEVVNSVGEVELQQSLFDFILP